MPSTVHEVLVQAVRDAPQLVQALLVSAGHTASDGSVSLEDAGLPSLVSALTADALLLIRQPGPAGASELAVVVEVQLEVDDNKLYTWPSYQAAARYRHRCPAMVVVICPSDRVATWAAREVSLDRYRSTFAACAFGPKDLARLDVASAGPELKWLVAYALRDDVERGPKAFAEATDALALLLDEALVELYCKTLSDALSPAVRAHYKALDMNQPSAKAPSTPEDPLVARMLDLIRARREALAVGRAEGREAGRLEGKALGEAEGKAEGKAEALLLILRTRGVDLPDVAITRIRSESDTQVLDAWLLAALNAITVAEVFRAGPR